MAVSLGQLPIQITLTRVTALLALLSRCALGYEPIFSREMLIRRNVSRFRIGSPDNTICWNRSVTEDSFISPIDGHNHFRPFGGPAVPRQTYLDWMFEHGILFTTMFGIGQQMIHDPDKPMCCYYFHCPSLDYIVTPDPLNDRINAEEYEMWRRSGSGPKELQNQIHLTLSATFPNLQAPENDVSILKNLTTKHKDAFKWSGEINVFKHALAANGFFDGGERVTLERVQKGALDEYFRLMEDYQWPVTLHSDIGCDIRIAPKTAPEDLPMGASESAWDVVNRECQVPKDELDLAAKNFQFWKDLLDDHYPAFFDVKTNVPKENFIKIQHLQVWDSILNRYPNMITVWAHMGLCKELRTLHPLVHSHIMMQFFDRYPNLYTDVSWDIIPKLLLMNYDEEKHSAEHYSPENHADFDADAAAFLFNASHVEQLRQKLHDVWEDRGHKEQIHLTGSGAGKIGGPTYAMALYLKMFENYKDRFITGTDFVASYGDKVNYPGQLGMQARGCQKDKANHARQVTDTSSINIFLSDDAFSSIVLGKNFFKITGLDTEFAPPPVCTYHPQPFSGSDRVASTAGLLITTLTVLAQSLVGVKY